MPLAFVEKVGRRTGDTLAAFGDFFTFVGKTLAWIFFSGLRWKNIKLLFPQMYEIGVRSAWRRKGVGRALLNHMEGWMKTNDVSVVWVCADNEVAVDFYRGCGFGSEEPQPVYMTRELEIPPKKMISTLLSV